jgi:sugar-specific transcriptional regulator TrmB
MKKPSPLVSLGLCEEEIKIYEELIVRGASSPTELCVYTKMHRPALYLHLKGLETKDLISVLPSGKRKKYIASSPKKLKDLSSLREKSIQEEIIRLEDMVSMPKSLPRITVRQGTSAIRSAYEEMTQELKKDDVYYRYSSIDNATWIPGRYITDKAKQLRNAKDLQRFIITNEETKTRKSKNPNRSIKTVPKKYDLFKHNVGQLIYSNKVVIIDYNNEMVVVIDNGPIAAFQKALFKTFFSYL